MKDRTALVSVLLIAFVLLIPLAGAGGYVLHQESDPSIASVVQENLKLEAGTESDTWMYFVTKGPLKGQTADALGVLLNYTKAQLVAMGATEGKYVVASCANYSTTGETLALNAEVVQRCTTRTVTEAEVREYAKSLAQPPLAA